MKTALDVRVVAGRAGLPAVIRRVTLSTGDTTIESVTRRTGLQQIFLDALDVDTRAWAKPTIH